MAFDKQAANALLRKHPVAIAGAALALFFAGATYWRSGGLEERQTQLEELNRQGSRLETNLRYSARLDDQLASINSSLDAINERVIDPAALATNLQFFYRLESELGLKLVDLRQANPLPKAANATYVEVPYNVSVQGTYSQLLQFILRLESGAVFARTMTMNLIPGQQVEGLQDMEDPYLTLTLNLRLLGKS